MIGQATSTICIYNGIQYPIGARLLVNNIPSFCALNGSFVEEKNDGTSCNNNFECLNELCSNGKCANKYASLSILPNCSDGTAYGACSVNKPKFCWENNLIDKCDLCLCPRMNYCLGNGSCLTITPVLHLNCSDNTENGTCSTNKPKFCLDGNLVDNCSTCGCPSQKGCLDNGSCYRIEIEQLLNFNFSLKICKDVTCNLAAQSFVVENTVFIDYYSNVSALTINATVEYPDGSTHRLDGLPASVIPSETGLYTISAIASKNGYNTKTDTDYFGVEQKIIIPQSQQNCSDLGLTSDSMCNNLCGTGEICNYNGTLTDGTDCYNCGKLPSSNMKWLWVILIGLFLIAIVIVIILIISRMRKIKNTAKDVIQTPGKPKNPPFSSTTSTSGV